MGGRHCCVKNCRRRSHDHYGRRIPNGLSFHCFPAWRTNEGGHTSELTRRRREAWVAAVGRSTVTFNHIPSSMRVCSRHFHSGKPAYEMLESDPDWVPSLHLGHDDGGGRHAERPPAGGGRPTCPPSEVEAGGGPGPGPGPGPERRAVPPWSEVKSLLQSVLQRRSIVITKPGDETPGPPAVTRTELSFRDFFRGSLDAALEASSRSRTLPAGQKSSSGEFELELSFKLPPLTEAPSTSTPSTSTPSTSTPSCLNCVRLQRRISELQERLPLLSDEDVDTEDQEPDQEDPQSPEIIHLELNEPEWMEPLSPPQWVLHTVDDGADWEAESTPAGPAAPQENRPKRKPRPRPHFRKVWLKMFWFLRYSPTQDHMWCHVCRLHAAAPYQKMSLIRGSRRFKVDNIKKHSITKYHRDNVERHKKQEQL